MHSSLLKIRAYSMHALICKKKVLDLWHISNHTIEKHKKYLFKVCFHMFSINY